MTFVDAEYVGKRKQTCKELFVEPRGLFGMNNVDWAEGAKRECPRLVGICRS